MTYQRSIPTAPAALLSAALLAGSGCAHVAQNSQPRPPLESLTPDARTEQIRAAQVWTPTDVASMDLRAGPSGKQAFTPEQAVVCDYVEKKLSGTTPKFTCAISKDDEAKVRYSADNGEVYASVMASRLFWALGFGADALYPVRVTCRGCPADPWKNPAPGPGEAVFDFAVIERKMVGKTLSSHPDQGWKWRELDLVDESMGGASLAQRDALKLLASLVEHIDSKDEQQRLICLPAGSDKEDPVGCAHPFLMVHDLGVTFGSGGLLSRHLNRNGAANFKNWAEQTVFRDAVACEGSVSRSFQGNLNHPVISEAGRKFLADLLLQLSDKQIQDMFAVARVDMRSRNPGSDEPPTGVDEWVQAFKRKRDEIANRHCPEESFQ